jgi:hypothetical protein
MPKKRRARRGETISRSVEISTFSASVRLNVDAPREPDPQIEAKPWLELRGTMSEPVREVHEIEFSVYPDPRTSVGTARPPGVGSIIQVRPRLVVVVSFTDSDFDRVWSLALSGHLTHAHIIFTEPHYNKARVTNLSFSNEHEE